jgi:phosphate transport system protein
MSMHLQREIATLKKMILSLSAIVEASVQKAVASIEKRDGGLAQEVIEADIEIDQIEVDVEEACLKTLALHQPVAIDLRFIVAVLKINNDLERIGDLAVNIAERTLFLVDRPVIAIPFDFEVICRKALQMLRISLDALMNMDPARAQQVMSLDDEVDKIHRESYAKTCGAIRANPDHAEILLSYLSGSRDLERIADHAANIAEDVVYLVQGWIVRHGGLLEDEPPAP